MERHILQVLIRNSILCQITYHLLIPTLMVIRTIHIFRTALEIPIHMLDHSYQRSSQMVPTHQVPRYLWIVILHLYYYQLPLLKMIPQIKKDHHDGVGIEEGLLGKDLLPHGNERLLLLFANKIAPHLLSNEIDPPHLLQYSLQRSL